jgi:transcriptional regulator with XRE-family HTH domain
LIGIKPKILQKQFGLNVRKYKLKVGLSQEALDHTTGIDRPYIGKIEKGEANISIKMFVTISSVLNITPDELLIL